MAAATLTPAQLRAFYDAIKALGVSLPLTGLEERRETMRLPRVRGLVQEFLDAHHGSSEETRAGYRYTLLGGQRPRRPPTGFVPFARAFPRRLPTSHRDLNRYFNALPAAMSRERRDTIWRHLHAFYAWVGRTYKVWGKEDNPIRLVERPQLRRRERRFFTLQELATILTWPGYSRRDRALLHLIADGGPRLGDITVRWEDFVDPPVPVPGVAKLLRVGRDGKSGERYIPVSPETMQLLLGLGDGEYVFTTRRGRPLGRRYASVLVRRLLARAGITGRRASAHTLRHTVASLAQGDLLDLQYLLGHSSPSVTALYRHGQALRVAQSHAQFSLVRLVYAHLQAGGNGHGGVAAAVALLLEALLPQLGPGQAGAVQAAIRALR